MLTGKQKGFLRSLANTIDPIIQIGKGGISPTVLSQVDEALEARELIKARALKSCSEVQRALAEQVAEALNAEVVQIIGRNFLIYREALEAPQIRLP